MVLTSQNHLRLIYIFLQAQYYRDPANLETYLSANRFLPHINNEIQGSRNETHKRNLSSLNNLVLVMFTKDKTVIPRDTSWFGAEVVNEDGKYDTSQTSFSLSKQAKQEILPMRLQPIYLEDWIGLRVLDERGAIIFEECEGEHMQLGKCWQPLVERFAGGFL
jgi:palmitoyl-protein thioesterase